MSTDVKQYVEELFKEAGVSDDNMKQAVANFFSNEKVTKRLGDDILRQSDYSRNMDTLKKERADNATAYQNMLKWRDDKQKEIDNFYASLENPNDGGNDKPNGNQPAVLTVEAMNKMKEEFDTRLKTQETQFISLLKGVGDITSDYVTRFKEKPDLNAIEKIAVEKQIPLTQAYQEYIQPRVQEIDKAARDASMKAEYERGLKDARSKGSFPVDAAPREFHPVMDDKTGRDAAMPPAGPARDQWIRQQFINDLNTPTTATSGGTT